MAQNVCTEANTMTSAQKRKERMKTEHPEKCGDIGKSANMEDTRKIKKRSLSEPTVKQRQSSKSLFSNLFSRKKVNFVGKSWHLIFVFLRKVNPKRKLNLKMIMEYQETLLQMMI